MFTTGVLFFFRLALPVCLWLVWLEVLVLVGQQAVGYRLVPQCLRLLQAWLGQFEVLEAHHSR